MKTLPQITEQEKVFVRNLVSGCSEGEAFECAWPKEAADLPITSRDQLGKKYGRKTHIKAWVKFLQDAKPDEMINNVYLTEIAFGRSQDQLKAAESYVNSNYAGKEIAHLFLETLQKIQAEIIVPCGKHVDRTVI